MAKKPKWKSEPAPVLDAEGRRYVELHSVICQALMSNRVACDALEAESIRLGRPNRLALLSELINNATEAVFHKTK
jgi:hypothetical protein